jgi:hypothetical protein
MTSKLENFRSELREYADAMDRIYPNFPGKYTSTHKLIVELGIGFERKIKSSFIGQPQKCQKNAFDVVIEYPKPELYYCEGFATYADLGLPIYHAWLINERGEIVDPTWHEPESFIEHAYIGVVFDREFARTVAVETGSYGILENDQFRDRQIKRLGLAAEDLCPLFHDRNRTPPNVDR